MAGTRIVVDGLWRCLCPSVDAAALLRAVNESTPARPVPRRGQRSRSGQIAHRPFMSQSRQLCTTIPSIVAPVAPISPGSIKSLRRVHADATARIGRLELISSTAGGQPLLSVEDTHESADSGVVRRPRESSRPQRGHDEDQKAFIHLLRARPPYRRQLAAASTAAIYEALRYLQDSPEGFDRVEAFSRYLLEDRKEAPTATLCEALLRANCSTRGSAEAVRDVLRVLQESKIEGTPGLFHAALAVLAVHPDYLTRVAVLQEMKERWIDMSPDGLQNIALGLLRDGQYERALDQLDTMTEAASTVGAEPVASWLLDIYVYVFCQEGFLDDALKIINHRILRENDTVSLNIWSFLLEACCRWGHYEGVVYVWNRVVHPGSGRGILAPSDATSLAVLYIAAQNGDSNLAAAVMQLLASRGTKLSLSHFEAMLDCYSEGGSIKKALQVLCIMNNAGIVPDQGSTRSIFLSLVGDGTSSSSASRPTLDDATTALFDLKKQYGSVPLAAFNVVVESLLEHESRSQNIQNEHSGDGAGVRLALDLYRHVRQLCPAGPNRTTFRLFFRACTNPQHLDFLVHEMRSFGIQPDSDMIDRVVYQNARNGSLEVALRHVHSLMSAGELAEPETGEASVAAEDKRLGETPAVLRRQPWISRWAAAALAKRCIDEGDDRILAIAEASRKRGRPMDTILAEIKRDTPVKASRSNAYGVPHLINLGEEEDEVDDGTLSS